MQRQEPDDIPNSSGNVMLNFRNKAVSSEAQRIQSNSEASSPSKSEGEQEQDPGASQLHKKTLTKSMVGTDNQPTLGNAHGQSTAPRGSGFKSKAETAACWATIAFWP